MIISTGQRLKSIQCTVPFLTIAPDARAGAMGDAGVATDPDLFSQHWNPAKYAFLDSKGGLAISYTPWLRKLINDFNLFYVSGFYRVNQKQTINASFRYFSLGTVVFTNIYGTNQGQYNPNEFAIDASYSRLLSDNFSGAVALRFIRSDLTGGNYVSGAESRPGIAFAGDLALYYRKDINIARLDSKTSFGLHLSNIGNKISYAENQEKAFIPINLGIGGSYLIRDKYNSYSLNIELNKLLVPTPPVYMTDSLGNFIYNNNGNKIILAGMDPSVSVMHGMIQSFYDAPGVISENGGRIVLKEELNEITYSIGAEFCSRYFAFRSGYFHEHETKGNRKFFTVGVGIKTKRYQLGLSYLIPTEQNSPLSNTFHFSLSMILGMIINKTVD